MIILHSMNHIYIYILFKIDIFILVQKYREKSELTENWKNISIPIRKRLEGKISWI